MPATPRTRPRASAAAAPPAAALVQRIHHVAYRCRDAKETVEWYQQHLGMDFVLAIAEDRVPSTHAPDPYMHVFLDAGGGNVLAFFELPNSPSMGRDANTPEWVQHIAFKVDSVAMLKTTKARLEAAGIEVVGPPTTRSSSRSTSSTPTATGSSWPPTPPRRRSARSSTTSSGRCSKSGARRGARPSTRPGCTSGSSAPSDDRARAELQMLKTYTWPRFAARPAPELGATGPRRVPLLIVGAGPVGLAAAIDAAQRGLPVVLLDDDDTVSIGSRGLCYAKRTLEILDRLGVGQRVVDKGVTWNIGRTFHREREVFAFDLLPEAGHRRPGMVNLQQYYLEQYLVDRAAGLPAIDLRWKHRVASVEAGEDGTTVQVESAEGPYTLRADWLIVADGAKSPIRRQLGLDIEGQVFQDRFLIADVVLDGEPFPLERTERRFWFEPPFFAGQSVLMHREADDVWRIDFQLGWEADPEAEKQPGRVAPRIRALLDQHGFSHIGFELEWVSVYTFQCRRMRSFRHGRLLFVGDCAHQVSPFGARGANSGVQDTDNLLWKLQLVIDGRAPEALLDSYAREREAAADENLMNSTRATDFMTPKSRAARVLREAVLSLAAELPAGRALVNSGRLSVPSTLADSPLNTADEELFEGWMVPGAPMDDAPVREAGREGWLLPAFGEGFALMLFGAPDAAQCAALAELAAGAIPVHTVLVLPTGAAPVDGLRCLEDAQGVAARRYDARPGTVYLLRPDQHVAARWRTLAPGRVRAALDRATARTARTGA
jgi:3-(3-hydroxy-phenyl)propionate hydroxylase